MLLSCSSDAEKGVEAFEDRDWQGAVEWLSRVEADDEEYAQARELLPKALLNRGLQAFDKRDWDAAVEYLSRVRPEDERYGLAADLLPIAVLSQGNRRVERAESLAERRRWEDVDTVLLPIPADHPLAGRAAQLRAQALVPPDYGSLRFVFKPGRVRSGPSTEQASVLSLKPRDALRLGPANTDGWAVVHRHYPSDEGGSTTDDGGMTPEMLADTVGYVSVKLLKSEAPTPRPAASASDAEYGGEDKGSFTNAGEQRRRWRRGDKYTLRTGIGGVYISSSSEWWDDEHTVAVVPEGTTAVLLRSVHYEDVPGYPLSRCQVRTTSGRTVTGWVMCGDLN